MKKLAVSIALMALMTTAGMAQPEVTENTGKMKHGKKHQKGQKVMQNLNLTEAQKAEMQTSRADFKSQMKAINANENQTVKQQRDQRAALAKAQKAKMESILTPEQKTKMAEMKTQAVAKHQERSAKRLDKMKQELSLTDGQVETIKKNQDATKSKLQALKANDKMDPAAKREQLKAMHDDMKNNIASVLTPEQKQKMDNRKQAMKGKMKDRKGRMDRRDVK